MRKFPEIEWTEEQDLEAQRIEDILAASAKVEVRYIARLLASKSNREPFGETEFQIRDVVHWPGAEGIDTALSERNKRGTKDRVVSAQDAKATPSS